VSSDLNPVSSDLNPAPPDSTAILFHLNKITMANVYFIPHKDADFNNWVTNFVNTARALSAQLQIPADRGDALWALLSVWAQKYEASENPATRTKVAIVEKSDARRALEKAVQEFIREYLRFNHLVTDGDRVALGIPIPDPTHTPVPVPTTYPDLTIEPDGIRRLRLSFRDHDKKSTAHPAGVVGAFIRWALLPAQPVAVEELTNSALDTRTPYVFTFEENQRGLTLYVAAAWQNTKGEKGAWSEIVSGIVP